MQIDSQVLVAAAILLIAVAFFLRILISVLELNQLTEEMQDQAKRLEVELPAYRRRMRARRQSVIEDRAHTRAAFWTLARFDADVERRHAKLLHMRAVLDRRRETWNGTPDTVLRMYQHWQLLRAAMAVRRALPR